MTMREAFNRFTHKVAMIAGMPATIIAAFAAVVIWAVMGPFLDFSDAWQLTINTATTILTFLMVFIIQNSQNRDSLAIQIKLDELLRTQEAAQNVLFDLEKLSAEELETMLKKYEDLSATARKLKQERHGVLPIDGKPIEAETAAKALKEARDRAPQRRRRAASRTSKA